MIKRIVVIACVVSLSVGTYAQDLRKLQETFIEAEYFFLYQEFSDALPFYQQLYEALPDNSNIAYRIGLCYLNIPGRKIGRAHV